MNPEKRAKRVSDPPPFENHALVDPANRIRITPRPDLTGGSSPVPRTVEKLPTPVDACARILSLAEPVEPIEVSLVDALGMILAEPAIADVDLPPFDRTSSEGYAVRSVDARIGTLLRVAGLRWSDRSGEDTLEAGEAIHVMPGDPLPVGADAVIALGSVIPDPQTGPTRVIQVIHEVEAGHEVARRGHLLEAGTMLAPAGTKLKAAMVSLLASQGYVHPVCHRRVRVAVMAIGDHLVGPSEAPVMHRERNAVNAAIVALSLQAGAMPHDLQAVAESGFSTALERATSAPVIIVLGRISRSIARTYQEFGVEPVISGVAMRPGGRTRHGVIRGGSGEVSHHVFHLPHATLAASTAFALLVQPLIARLQGNPAAGPRTLAAVWDGTHRPTGDRLRAVPVTLTLDLEARLRARPIALRGSDDLPGFARADGLVLLPARSGPWLGGEVVEYIPFDLSFAP
jgi:molybdopterin molybdotransferase